MQNQSQEPQRPSPENTTTFAQEVERVRQRIEAEKAAEKEAELKKPNFSEHARKYTETELKVCQRCGQSKDIIRAFTKCAECSQLEEEEREREAEQRRLTQRVADAKSKFGAVAYEKYRLDNYKLVEGNKEAYELCKDFDLKRDDVFLWGNAGSGKTHLGTAVAIREYMKGGRVFVFTPKQLGRFIRDDKGFENEYSLEQLQEAPLLFIDDLGRVTETAYVQDILCEILDYRFNHGTHGLIVTSNLFLDDLAIKLDNDRLTSRIGGMCKVSNCAPKFADGSLRDWRIAK